ncbi:MAG: hypothetical protein PVJ27_08960 [Candidatus Brocadiaceae bacterium]
MIIEGVQGYQVTDPWAECVRVVMAQRGETHSAAYVQGVSGMAFRLAGPCPCAPTCSAPMDVPGLAALFGYEAEGHYLGGEQEDVDARLPELVARVKDEVRTGRAVIVWHAFTTAEWDVVCGYEDAQGLFYGRGSYGDMRGEEYASAQQERMGSCLDVCPALGVVLVGEKSGSLEARAAEVAALKEAVRHGREPGHRLEASTPQQRANSRYRKGPDPYESWAADPPSGWNYCLDVTRSRRRMAPEFLREIAPKYPAARDQLLAAAESFAAEVDVLDEVMETVCREDMDEAARKDRAAQLFIAARRAYLAGMDRIEAALAAIE